MGINNIDICNTLVKNILIVFHAIDLLTGRVVIFMTYALVQVNVLMLSIQWIIRKALQVHSFPHLEIKFLPLVMMILFKYTQLNSI